MDICVLFLFLTVTNLAVFLLPTLYLSFRNKQNVPEPHTAFINIWLYYIQWISDIYFLLGH